MSAPANGTATYINTTIQMQQYVGFYGNVTLQVRKSGGSEGTSIYNRSVLGGCVFVNDGDVGAIGNPITSAPDAFADGNFSLTGGYITKNLFDTTVSLCGVALTFTTNTTDNYAVGIFRDGNSSTAKHYTGANIFPKTSTNLGGDLGVNYEIIVPKTATYGNAGYDFYVDIGS